MSEKVAVAIVHGIGREVKDFAPSTEPEKLAAGMIQKLKSSFAKMLNLGEDTSALVFESVYWEPILRDSQGDLWEKIESEAKFNDFFGLRKFLFQYLSSSLVFQGNAQGKTLYEAVNQELAHSLKTLAETAGENAPLCVISQNIGSIIISNYFWDLQRKKKALAEDANPLERGETLTLFYTLGSPIAVSSMLYNDGGTPITVPSSNLDHYYPGLEGEWINFYDRDDFLGYPLKNINDQYRSVVTVDQEVKIRNLLTGISPLAHSEYWTNDEVNNTIAKSLARVWISINNEAQTTLTLD